MKTRTLILLAVACGVAILAAGVAFFIRIATHKDELTVPSIKGPNESQQVGQVTATVTGSSSEPGFFVVSVRLDAAEPVADAGAGWSLYIAGDSKPRPAVAPPASAATVCAQTPVAAGSSLECTVAFTDGSGDHYVAYAHDGIERRWKL